MSRSLGSCLEPFIDPPPSIRGHGYLVMVRKLCQLLAIGNRFSSHPRKREFLQSLKPAEERVLYLLEEWWGGLIQEDLLAKWTKGTLFAYAIYETGFYGDSDSAVGFEEFLDEEEDRMLYWEVKKQVLETREGVYYHCLARRAILERQRSGGIVDDPILEDRTAYNRALFHLAKLELLLANCPEERRNSTREHCGRLAACQRVANECITIGLSLVRPSDEGILVELAGRQLRVAIDGTRLREPRVVKVLRNSIWNPGASIERCPWLTAQRAGATTDDEDDDSASGLFPDLPPFYLWHIKERRTVKVFDLAVAPWYAVISHTWGRWRIPGVDVPVEGVPWPVPANTRFDVATLPSLLQNAGFVEDYVWIDLFCIPQDRNDSAQQSICRVELMRQGSIFHNAQTAVAWLFEVEDWRPTAAALAYMAIEYHNNCTSDDTELTPLYEMVLETTARFAGDRCGLVLGDFDDEEKEVIGWFSSLWTLQEALMRPDILLLNRNWEPLTVWHVTITLDTIASLVMCRHMSFNSGRQAMQQLALARERDKRLPVGAREVYGLFSMTGMVQIAAPSQLSALILGGKRVCKHSRSQAIMSVAGATKWFRKNEFQHFRHPESEDKMIFGLYEPEFINEVYRLVGGSFFMCRNEATTVSTPDGTTRNDRIRTISLISGSMLPFSPGSAARFCHIPSKERGFVDHPSIAGWRIGVGRDIFTGFRGGDVLLPTVAILAANCEFESKPHFPLTETASAPSSATELASPAVTPPVAQPTINRRVPPRSRPLKGTVQGNPPATEYDPAKPVELDEIDIDEWLAKFDDDTFAVCVMSTRAEVHGVLLQRPGFGHGPLVKIGVFEVEDEKGIEMPETCQVNWTVV